MTIYQGVHDARWTLVVKAANVADANVAAREVEPDGDTFTVPLRAAGDATNMPVAYWCGWQMPSGIASQLATSLRAKVGLTGAQVAVIQATDKAGYQPPNNWKLLCFDGTFDSGWTPDEVLAKLGLDTLASPQLP